MCVSARSLGSVLRTLHKATTGIEPVDNLTLGLGPNLLDWLKQQEPTVELYAEHFRKAGAR